LVAMGVGITIAFVRAIHELGNLYDQEIVSLKDLEGEWPGEETMSESLKKRVLKLRLDGPLFFGVSDTMYRTITQLADFDYLIIRMMRVPMVDMSGAYLLDDIVEKAHRQGAKVLITGMEPAVRATLGKLRIIDRVGEENCFDHFEDAAARVQQLDDEARQNGTPRTLVEYFEREEAADVK
jgi:sulfate permease, SulP family